VGVITKKAKKPEFITEAPSTQRFLFQNSPLSVLSASAVNYPWIEKIGTVLRDGKTVSKILAVNITLKLMEVA